MPAYDWSVFRSEMDRVILATLPTLAQIWQMDEAIRESWEERQLPFVVHENGDKDPGDWGATRESFEWDWSCHLVALEAPEDGGGLDYVEAQLELLRVALRTENQGVTGVGEIATLLRVFISAGRDAEVNRIFYGKNVPFVGGTLRCRYEGGVPFT